MVKVVSPRIRCPEDGFTFGHGYWRVTDRQRGIAKSARRWEAPPLRGPTPRATEGAGGRGRDFPERRKLLLAVAPAAPKAGESSARRRPASCFSWWRG